jgi:hypothetical protein
MQMPQPLQSSCLISALSASSSMASCGQRLKQTPQPVQRASSMTIMGYLLASPGRHGRVAGRGWRLRGAEE